MITLTDDGGGGGGGCDGGTGIPGGNLGEGFDGIVTETKEEYSGNPLCVGKCRLFIKDGMVGWLVPLLLLGLK